MPAEETYRFKAVLDLSELYTQLAQARSELGAVLGDIASPVTGAVTGALGGAQTGIARVESGAGAAAGHAGDVVRAAGSTFDAFREHLPFSRAGEHVAGIGRQVSGVLPPELSGGYGGAGNPMHAARMRARHDYISGGFASEELAASGAGLLGAAAAGATLGSVVPGAGTLVGAGVGIAAYMVADTLARPFTGLLFDEERTRDHMMARGALEDNVILGAGHVGRSASGLMDAGVSYSVASRQIERGMRDRQLSVRDMSQISAIAGRSGMLSGVTGSDPGEFSDNLNDRLIEIEGRVKRLKTSLGTDTGGAMGSLLSGMEAGFTESQAERMALMSPSVFRTAGVSQAAGQQALAFGSQVFGQMGLSGAAGMNAAQSGLMSARAMVDSGSLSASSIVQMGGVSGIARLETAQAGQFIRSGFGSALLQADQLSPGALRKYAMGGSSAKEIGQVFREINGDPYSLMMARYGAAKGLRSVDMDMIGAASERAMVDQFKSTFGEDKMSVESMEAFAQSSGYAATPAEAEVLAHGAWELVSDPDAYAERQEMRSKESARSEQVSLAQETRRQRTYERRKDFMDAVNPMKAEWVKSARAGLSGTLKDAASMETRAETARGVYQDRLVAASQVDSVSAGQMMEDARDELTLSRRERMRVSGGLVGYVRSYTSTLLADTFADKMDQIPFLEEVGIRYQEGMAGENKEAVDNPDVNLASNAVGGGDELSALHAVVNLLSDISRKLD